MKPQRIQELDSLRGIAAISVVLFHYIMRTKYQDKTPLIYGITGVDLFFIISGYVIFLSINRGNTWKDFVISRFSRLYPAYWFSVGLTSVLYYIFRRPSFHWETVVANLTMVQRWLGQPDLDGPYWTLLVELIFYALMLVLLLTRQLKNIFSIGVGFLAVLFMFHYFLPASNPALYQYITYNIPFVSHAPLFFAGIVFFKLREREKWYDHLTIVCCLLFASYLHDRGGRAREFISAEGHAAALTVYFFVFYLFVYGKLGLVTNRVTLFLGKISYSLYLTHEFISRKVLIPELMKATGISRAGVSVISLTIVLILATLVNKYIEEPSNAKVKAYLKKVGQKKQIPAEV